MDLYYIIAMELNAGIYAMYLSLILAITVYDVAILNQTHLINNACTRNITDALAAIGANSANIYIYTYSVPPLYIFIMIITSIIAMILYARHVKYLIENFHAVMRDSLYITDILKLFVVSMLIVGMHRMEYYTFQALKMICLLALITLQVIGDCLTRPLMKHKKIDTEADTDGFLLNKLTP
jgi:hypothetical protein